MVDDFKELGAMFEKMGIKDILSSFEFQAEQAYTAFERAVRGRNPNDMDWSDQLYNRLTTGVSRAKDRIEADQKYLSLKFQTRIGGLAAAQLNCVERSKRYGGYTPNGRNIDIQRLIDAINERDDDKVDEITIRMSWENQFEKTLEGIRYIRSNF